MPLFFATLGHTSTSQNKRRGLLEEARSYDLFERDEMTLPSGLTAEPRLVWDQVMVKAKAVDALAEALVAGPWTSFLERARGRVWRA